MIVSGKLMHYQGGWSNEGRRIREFLQQVVPRSRGSSEFASFWKEILKKEKDYERFSNYRLPNRRGNSRGNMRTSNWQR